MFSSAISLNSVESLQKGALHFLFDNYDFSYESILKKLKKLLEKVQGMLIDSEVFVLKFLKR